MFAARRALDDWAEENFGDASDKQTARTWIPVTVGYPLRRCETPRWSRVWARAVGPTVKSGAGLLRELNAARVDESS